MGSDIFFGIVLAVLIIKFVLWLIRPPRWQDLDSRSVPYKDYQEPWLWW